MREFVGFFDIDECLKKRVPEELSYKTNMIPVLLAWSTAKAPPAITSGRRIYVEGRCAVPPVKGATDLRPGSASQVSDKISKFNFALYLVKAFWVNPVGDEDVVKGVSVPSDFITKWFEIRHAGETSGVSNTACS